jgi:hypothetical protein
MVDSNAGGGSKSGFRGLHDGLSLSCPESSDASTKLPGGPSVNVETRTTAAPSPSTLGPRSA